MIHPLTRRLRRGAVLGVVTAIVLASCGGDDDAATDDTATAVTAVVETAEAPDPTDPPETNPPETDPPETNPPVTSSASAEQPAGLESPDLEAEVEAILERSLTDDGIAWNVGGIDVPPTGVNAAVRIPGRDDVLVAAGANVDGTPFDSDGVYDVSGLQGRSLVTAIAWQLADDGVLDLDAKIDAWLPDQPNAERITVGMLADQTSGLSAVDTAPYILADLTRRWTLAEVLDAIAVVPPLHEPGTFDEASTFFGTTALAYIAEQVTGATIAELVETRIAEPLGLDDTYVQDGTNDPPNYQEFVFALEGQAFDSTMVPRDSFDTFYAGNQSVASTSADLLDLLDAFVEGTLFTTDRTPTGDRFVADRLVGGLELGGHVSGLGIPLVGYCPCEPGDGDTMNVAAVGRRTDALGTNVSMVRFPDGISVVLHYNSSEVPDNTSIWPTILEVHDAAARWVTGR